MSITILLAAVGIRIACSPLVSIFLSKPLYQLLGDLCGTAQRARFWHHYTTLMLLLVPLRRTLICVLLGQVIALTTVGFKLASFIQKMPQELLKQQG